MTVPTSPSYSVAALIAAQASFLALIDAGSGPGFIAVRGADDVLLASIVLDSPAGAVDGAGQLALSWPGGDVAVATGTAAYGEVCDSNGTVLLALPVQQGQEAVPGYLVINTLTIIAGAPVDAVIATVG
jgi:hypothetical protein